MLIRRVMYGWCRVAFNVVYLFGYLLYHVCLLCCCFVCLYFCFLYVLHHALWRYYSVVLYVVSLFIFIVVVSCVGCVSVLVLHVVHLCIVSWFVFLSCWCFAVYFSMCYTCRIMYLLFYCCLVRVEFLWFDIGCIMHLVVLSPLFRMLYISVCLCLLYHAFCGVVRFGVYVVYFFVMHCVMYCLWCCWLVVFYVVYFVMFIFIA